MEFVKTQMIVLPRLVMMGLGKKEGLFPFTLLDDEIWPRHEKHNRKVVTRHILDFDSAAHLLHSIENAPFETTTLASECRDWSVGLARSM